MSLDQMRDAIVTFFSSGWFVKPECDSQNIFDEYLQNHFSDEDLERDFQALSNQSIHDILLKLSEIPHLAGDVRDLALANYIKDQFIAYGLDHAEVSYGRSSYQF